jgi:hypothetical protein
MNEGQIIPYSRLVDYALGYEGGDASLLKTHICHIRQKLRLPSEGEGAIRSLPTVGYSLVKRRNEPAASKANALTELDRAESDDPSAWAAPHLAAV